MNPIHALLRSPIHLLDSTIRRAAGIFEFSDDPDCLIRLQLSTAPRCLALPDKMVNAGEPVLILHLMNERIPPIPPDGPSLSWAIQSWRMFSQSLVMLAKQIEEDPRLSAARALGGVTVLIDIGGTSQEGSLLHKLGFTIFPYRSRLGRFGEFWENLYTWMLMWTFNPASLRHRKLFRLRRHEFWMTADEFLRRFKPADIEEKYERVVDSGGLPLQLQKTQPIGSEDHSEK